MFSEGIITDKMQLLVYITIALWNLKEIEIRQSVTKTHKWLCYSVPKCYSLNIWDA